MSIETKYVCDVCGAVRGEANHWFEALVAVPVESLAITKFKGRKGLAHLCGQKCVHTLLDRWLTTGSLEPVPAL